jgi:hypothetical protein
VLIPPHYYYLTNFILLILIVLAGFFAAACGDSSGGGGSGGDPELTGSVNITGLAKEGRELAANTGSLGGNGTISYQWQISGSADGTYANIPGAANSTYTPGSGDVGKYLKVTVTRAGYSGSETSPATAAVASADTPDPTVTGVNITGPSSVAKGGTETYTAEVTGTNSPPETVTWTIVETGRKDGTTISGAGVLSVANDEVLASITVKAASTFDPGQSGTKTVTLTGGGSPAEIDAEDFGPSASVAQRFNVYSETTWNAACSAIQSGGNDKNYVITLTGDFAIPGISGNYTFGSVTGLNVSLRGNKTLSLGSSGSLLRTGANQTLVLRESALVGRGGNSLSLVNVGGAGSSFTMRSGKISGNSNSSNSHGGGVYVSDGSFTMTDGEISGNSGGGVYVEEDGSFTMSGGEISGNSAYSDGDNMSVNTFTMTGGKITGNSTTYGSVMIGYFIMEDGVISDTHVVAANTIMSGGEITGSYVNIGYANSRDCTFTMSGGKITGSEVRIYRSDFIMSGGEISGGYGVSVGSTTANNNYRGSTFTMSGGKISGNSAGNYGGGGVLVGLRSSFTMTGGEISGNSSANSGGGVCIYDSSGVFTMSGGEISGNSANSGGGVFVNLGSFSKTGGGVIYGSDAADSSLKNTAGSGDTNGDAVYYVVDNSNGYYRNTTLNAEDDISTSDKLPSTKGETLNNWTKR